MEKLNCNVVYDLLPLYLDGLCSEESKRMVEEHIESCVECRKALENMKRDITILEDTDVEVIKKVKRRIWIEKIVVVFVVLFIVANILFIGGIHLLSDQVSMKDMITADNVYIEEDTNGDLWLVRGGNAVYASHVIQEQYTPDGRLIIGMEETEVEDYKGEKVIDVVLSESRISRITHQILGDTASIEEEKSLLFNMDEKTDRCKVVIKTADGEVILWERK